jgi:hypothetical protein
MIDGKLLEIRMVVVGRNSMTSLRESTDMLNYFGLFGTSVIYDDSI